LPRRNPLEMSDLNPSEYALKVWKEERKLENELCEEVRRNTLGVGMKPVHESTRPVATSSDCSTIIIGYYNDKDI